MGKLNMVLISPRNIKEASEENSFIYKYNGFHSSHLYLDGIAKVNSNGLLRLTNDTERAKGYAFYPNPIVFKNTSNESVYSFSTTFVFAIKSRYTATCGHGLVFVVSPTKGLPNSLPSKYLGLFDTFNTGNISNHVFAVEFDTVQDFEFDDINDLKSVNSISAGYYDDYDRFKDLSLSSGYPMQVWIDYDGVKKKIEVTLAPISVGFNNKPTRHLLSLTKDLSPILNNSMYVGLSSSTRLILASHYVLGWSFKVNGQAQNLEISELHEPIVFADKKRVMYYLKLKKFDEVLEDWKHEYGPRRFKFKDLYSATKGFREKGLLGVGGFGRVYKGVIPSFKLEVAVKRVSHESRQGMREFVREIVSIGRLWHRNLVRLHGYCRRKSELLLVYDYMPNGSLDNYLYNQPKVKLNWSERFRIIKGVASGVVYLHEKWEKVVIHRDIKASNVLLDSEFNADPHKTHLAGTIGYLAHEHIRTGKATKFSDMFSFGAFLLEVACGRGPIANVGENECVILVDSVFECWKRGDILEAKDVNLGTDYVSEEVELVLKLGLLCSHSEPLARPGMRQVVQYLERDIPLPDLSLPSLSSSGLTFGNKYFFEDFPLSYPSSMDKKMSHTSVSLADSLLSGGC
ncbi:lectin-like receptor kinase family protein, putative [Medicago truncatula]|uniref:non-specific serine/threonine protein kinase n=1 Tax=Medicago truncatula TaxID=3880 RepID=A0A072U0N0_MEDTR|nr:lectin-like receptor kinase family protein, putative [Medicago truncatula]